MFIDPYSDVLVAGEGPTSIRQVSPGESVFSSEGSYAPVLSKVSTVYRGRLISIKAGGRRLICAASDSLWVKHQACNHVQIADTILPGSIILGRDDQKNATLHTVEEVYEYSTLQVELTALILMNNTSYIANGIAVFSCDANHLHRLLSSGHI